MRSIPSALLVCLLMPGCAPSVPPATRAPLETAGSLHLYLRPFPPAAAGLRFRLGEVAVVREDGAAIPLALRLDDLGPETTGRERLLADGTLPPGRYAGLSLRVRAAALEGEEGPAALLPPAEPLAIGAAFTVAPRRGVVLSLSLADRPPVAAGFRFAPAFSAAAPPRPASALLALASIRAANAVVLFDKVSGRVIGVVPTGRAPAGLALDAARHRGYVALPGEDAVDAIGLLEQAVLGRVQLRDGDGPLEMALTPDGQTLLVADAGSSTVSVIDALSLVETGRIPVGNGPQSIAIDSAGRRAYVFNVESSTVTVLDVASRRAVATLATEAEPFRGHLNRAGSRLYVIHRSSPYVTIVHLEGNGVDGRILAGPGAAALKVDPRTERIYLARRGTGEIEIFDPLSLLPADAIPVDGDVSFLAIDAEANSLYLALPDRAEVRVVRLVGKEVLTRVEVGDEPYAVALLGER